MRYRKDSMARAMAMLLALVMCLGLLPAPAFADETDGDAGGDAGSMSTVEKDDGHLGVLMKKAASAADIGVPTVTADWDADTKLTAQEMLNGMSLEEKVGQLFLLHWPKDGAGSAEQAKAQVIDKYAPGGLLVFAPMFTGGVTKSSVQDKIAAVQEASRAKSGIPLMISVDEEGGKVCRVSGNAEFRAEKFLGPQELKVAGNGSTSEIAEEYKKMADLLTELGINMDHAPVADTSDPSGYIYGRTWGGTYEENAEYVKAAVEALESPQMGTSLKHFPGYGSGEDTHGGPVVDERDEATLHEYMVPFKMGIDAGCQAVMVTHNQINVLDEGRPASLSPKTYALLRDEMGFKGLAMTDDLGMGAAKAFAEAEGKNASIEALNAGADMVITNLYDWRGNFLEENDITKAIAAAETGALPMKRVEEACYRVLCWKIAHGLIAKKEYTGPEEAMYSPAGGGAPAAKGTFADMWARAAKDGGTVTLLKDISVSTSFRTGTDMTLDLNGKTITATGPSSNYMSHVDFDEADLYYVFLVTAGGHLVVNDGGIEPIVTEEDVTEEGVPEEGVPEEGVPGEGVPGEGVPGEGVPGEGVPGEGVPGEDVPGEDVPGEDVPESELRRAKYDGETKTITYYAPKDGDAGTVRRCKVDLSSLGAIERVAEDGEFVSVFGVRSGETVKPASLTINGGRFSGQNCHAVDSVSAGDSTNKVTINGGAMVGNSGGMVANTTDVEMNGGYIAGNGTWTGGGMYIYFSSLEMNGGVIAGNEAEVGGGIATWYARKLEIRGGLITGNKANTYGGGLMQTGVSHIETDKRLISGGTICYNDAKYGGGIFHGRAMEYTENARAAQGGYMEITGGRIVENTAKAYGGGICLDNGDKHEEVEGNAYLNMSGDVVVKGNKLAPEGAEAGPNDIEMRKGAKLAVAGKLTGDPASIGVTGTEWQMVAAPNDKTDYEVTQDDVGKFFSDVEGLEVRKISSGLYLVKNGLTYVSVKLHDVLVSVDEKGGQVKTETTSEDELPMDDKLYDFGISLTGHGIETPIKDCTFHTAENEDGSVIGPGDLLKWLKGLSTVDGSPVHLWTYCYEARFVTKAAEKAPEKPGTEDPGTEDPDAEDPGTEKPGTEDDGVYTIRAREGVPLGKDALTDVNGLDITELGFTEEGEARKTVQFNSFLRNGLYRSYQFYNVSVNKGRADQYEDTYALKGVDYTTPKLPVGNGVVWSVDGTDGDRILREYVDKKTMKEQTITVKGVDAPVSIDSTQGRTTSNYYLSVIIDKRIYTLATLHAVGGPGIFGEDGSPVEYRYMEITDEIAKKLAPFGFSLEAYDGELVFANTARRGEDAYIATVPRPGPNGAWQVPFARSDDGNASYDGCRVYYLSKEAQIPDGNKPVDMSPGKVGFWSVSVEDYTVEDDPDAKVDTRYVPDGGTVELELSMKDEFNWVVKAGIIQKASIGPTADPLDPEDPDSPMGPEVLKAGSATSDKVNIEWEPVGTDQVRITLSGVHAPIKLERGVSKHIRYDVQYYANSEEIDWWDGEKVEVRSIPGVKWSDGTINALVPMIDTNKSRNEADPGKVQMPENGVTTSTAGIGITADGVIKTKTELKGIYQSRSYRYDEAPTLLHCDRLYMDTNYAIDELWVFKGVDADHQERDPNETERDDWIIYRRKVGPVPDDFQKEFDEESKDENTEKTRYLLDIDDLRNIYLTSSKEYADNHEDSILVKNGTVIRFVYNRTESIVGEEGTNTLDSLPVDFFDYDITDGYIYTKNGNKRLDTDQQTDNEPFYAKVNGKGINRLAGSEKSKQVLAFGNSGLLESGIRNAVAFARLPTTDKTTYPYGFCFNRSNRQLTWDGNTYKQAKPTYNYGVNGCAFGMVKPKLDPNGNISYIDGISAPALFNEDRVGSKNGDKDGDKFVTLPDVQKTDYGKTFVNNYALGFDRVGDTYTISHVKKLSPDGSAPRIIECIGIKSSDFPNGGDLAKLGHPGGYEQIWTNNFWPMDDSSTWGGVGHDMKFGSTTGHGETRLFQTADGGLKTFESCISTDDDQDHNVFFGMHFDLKFKIPEDYIGTLDFAFFGDDDVWAFLDGKRLIVDLGGIHFATGEYVNLWDYIEHGDTEWHTLSFFYMERGASGSTCWMRLTLPDAEFADILEDNEKGLEENFGQLEIRKEVDAGTGTPSGDAYAFSIDMSDEAGGPVKGECGYAITRGLEKISEGVIRSRDGNGGTEIAEYRNGELVPLEGGKFRLGDQDSILISNIPAGTRYTVREDEDPGKYSTTVTDGQGTVLGNKFSGSIKKRPDTGDGEDASKGIEAVRLTYVNSLAPVEGSPLELPKAGGTGTRGIMAAGGTLAAVAWACLAFKRRRRRA